MDSHYPAQLQQFANQYLKKYLDPASHHILIEKAQTFERELKKDKWKFIISRDDPITFKYKDSNLQIDIACKIEGIGDDTKKHSVEFRVCSKREDKTYVKFHIDQKVPDTPEPWHHLHMAGFKEPRFPYPPMDIILLSEFILINYFPTVSEDLRRDRGWKRLIINSQNIFQKEYYETCWNCIENNENTTLMEHLLYHH
ncbi:MAG: hypothetical protein ACTSQA_09210, partial [Candidatus Heimdallarchaeaceae archaeon]|jgi:hypothetical protein